MVYNSTTEIGPKPLFFSDSCQATCDGQEGSVHFIDDFCKVYEVALHLGSQRISYYKSETHAQNVKFYFQVHEEAKEKVSGQNMNTHIVNSQVHSDREVNKNKFSNLLNMSFDSSPVSQSHPLAKSHTQNQKQSLKT